MAFETDQQASYIESIHPIYPGIDIRSARQLIHDGEYNDILIINEELVFPFPRYAENIPGFLREIQLLVKLQGHLPLPIPNPIYTRGATTEPGKVFMGYRLIQGQPLHPDLINNIKDEVSLHELARQLADFLSILHRMPPGSLGLELPLQHMPDWVRSFYSEVRENLFSRMRPDARLSLTAHFEDYFNTPALQRYQPALTHGDFGGSNILLENGHISGVLDFSSAAYSDPALDIASVSTYGEPFFSHFCQFYPSTESLLGRAKFYRGIFALEEALYGWKNDDKEALGKGMEQYV
jgi:aminoglycoside 2''-phosphotransferase